MSFKRYIGADTKYQGTSFIRTITRRDELAWKPEHTSVWELVDKNSIVVATGNLVKVNGDLGFYLEISDTQTVALDGTYLLVAYLYDSSNTDADDIIMEYTLVYREVVPK